MNISPVTSLYTTKNNNHTKVNFKGEAERKLFESVVERNIKLCDGPYRKALKVIYEELNTVFKNKYSSKFHQTPTQLNEFTIKLPSNNSFKIALKKDSLECVDKGKSYEKIRGKFLYKSLTNEIHYESPAKKSIIEKKEYTKIQKDYAPNEAPFQHTKEKVYDSDLKLFINA